VVSTGTGVGVELRADQGPRDHRVFHEHDRIVDLFEGSRLNREGAAGKNIASAAREP